MPLYGIITDDIDKLLNDDSIDIAIELVGGTTFAKDLQIKILQRQHLHISMVSMD